MNLFEVVVRILISQLLRGLPLELTMQKPVFDGKFSKSHVFGGHFLLFLGDFRGVNVNFCVFDPQKALPYRKDIYRCIS